MRRFLIAQVIAIGAIVLVALAVIELRTGGVEAIGGLTIADRLAAAEEQNTPAPSFSIASLDGGTLSLEPLRGDVVVLNFWATWCGPCRREAPALQRLWREYRDRGVSFMGLNFRDDLAAARTFVDEFHLGYPSGFDPSGSLADDFGLYAMPTTFVIDPGGAIRYRFVGYLDEPTLRSAIEDMLVGSV